MPHLSDSSPCEVIDVAMYEGIAPVALLKHGTEQYSIQYYASGIYTKCKHYFKYFVSLSDVFVFQIQLLGYPSASEAIKVSVFW